MPERISTIRKERERGLILEILVAFDLDWVDFGELRMQLVRHQHIPISVDGLAFQLSYLRDRGFVEIKRLYAGKSDIEMTAVRATAHAVDLIDGRISEDPGVALE